jgi:hypothetical protein
VCVLYASRRSSRNAAGDSSESCITSLNFYKFVGFQDTAQTPIRRSQR